MRENFLKKAFADDGSKKPYYIVFTVFFCIMVLFCLSSCIFAGRSLIWHSDGWTQHFKAVVYYSDYLKEIFRHLAVDHKLIIPDWDFYIGEGGDIVSTMSYYAFGDPITLLSVFVPAKYMHYFFTVANIARLYLSGIAFSALCFGTGQKNRYGIMAGSLGCSFCSWSLSAMLHPFFINPMIWFPLLILGMEKIIRKEKPFLFIICTAVSAACNFYYFYMIVLLAILYALIRLGFLYRRQIREGIFTLLRIGVMAVIGVCMASVIFLPVLMIIAGDSRTSVFQTIFLLYPLSFYSQFPSVLLSSAAASHNYWACLGVSAPGLLALFILFLKKKEDTFLKVLFLVCLAIMLFPIGGRILNGMAYMTNRWSWAFIILCMYILAKKWNDLLCISRKQWFMMVILSAALYGLVYFCSYSRVKENFVALTVLFISLMIVRESSPDRLRMRQAVLVALCAVQAFLLAFWLYDPAEQNVAATMLENRLIRDKWEDNDSAIIKSVADDSEYTRYSGRTLSTNTSMFYDVSSTEYYWSITNPYYNAYRWDMEIIGSVFQNFQGFDDRTTPTALSAVQYYTVPFGDTRGIPFGYTVLTSKNQIITRERRLEQLKKELGVSELSDAQRDKVKENATESITIYTNDYPLPLGYCYDAYLPRETWDSLDTVQKQEVQLFAALVEEEPEGIKKADLEMPDYSIPYELSCQGTEISQIGSSFVTTKPNTDIVLTLKKDIPNAETYVEFYGLEFTPTSEYDLYFGDETVDPLNLYSKTYWDLRSAQTHYSVKREKTFWFAPRNPELLVTPSSGRKKKVIYRHPDSQITSGRHNFIINCGYTEEPVTTITITLPDRGVYTFGGINIYGISMDGYSQKIQKLQENALQNVTLSTDTLTGSITLDKEKLLCLSVPYSKGWEAFIDGEKTRVYNVNERHQGIVVPAGEHQIEFRYHLPFKRAGSALSVFGLAALLVLIILDRRKK